MSQPKNTQKTKRQRTNGKPHMAAYRKPGTEQFVSIRLKAARAILGALMGAE